MPVKTHTAIKRLGLLHIENTSIVDVGVAYANGHASVVRDQVVGVPEVSFTPYAPLWLVSVMMMTIGVVMIRTGRSADSAAVASFAFAFATAFAVASFASAALAAFSCTATFAFAAVAAFAASYFASITLSAEVKKARYFFAVLYYIGMAASMTAFLLI